MAPGMSRRPEANHSSSVLASPTSMMSTPRLSTPWAKASDIRGPLTRMSRPTTRPLLVTARSSTSTSAAPIAKAPSSSHSGSGPSVTPRMSLALKIPWVIIERHPTVCLAGKDGFDLPPARPAGSGVGVGQHRQVAPSAELDDAGATPWLLVDGGGGVVGETHLAHGVGQGQQVVGAGPRVRVAGEPDHLPPPRR